MKEKLEKEWGPAKAGAWTTDAMGNLVKGEESEDDWIEEKPDVRMLVPIKQ